MRRMDSKIVVQLCANASSHRRWLKYLQAMDGIEVAGTSTDLARVDPLSVDLVVFLAHRLDAPVQVNTFLATRKKATIFVLVRRARLDIAGDCLEAGAVGGAVIGPEGDAPEEIRQALIDTAAGKAGLTPCLLDWAFRRLAELGAWREAIPPRSPTSREIEILELLAQGFSNGEIAEHLGTSPLTVKNQLHEIYKILNARQRRKAVTMARRRGWID